MASVSISHFKEAWPSGFVGLSERGVTLRGLRVCLTEGGMVTMSVLVKEAWPLYQSVV